MPPPNICRTSALAPELSSGCNMPFEVTGRTKKRKNRQEQQSRKTEDDQVAQAPRTSTRSHRLRNVRSDQAHKSN